MAQVAQFHDHTIQALPLDELHRVEPDLTVLADLVNRHDVGVVQPRRGAGLAAKPLERRPVRRHMPGQHFEGHPPAERNLLGLINDTHAAPADLSQNPVITDLLQRLRCSPSLRLTFTVGFPLVDLLHLDQRREKLADFIGQLRIPLHVFRKRGPLSASEPLREFLRQLIQKVVLF